MSDRPDQPLHERKNQDRALVLPLVGLILLTPPVGAIFQLDAKIGGMTVTEVRGFGQQSGHTETYRGAEYQVDFVPKLKIEVLCDEGQSGIISDLIVSVARTDRVGAGKVWVTPVSGATRIRTGEVGVDAL